MNQLSPAPVMTDHPKGQRPPLSDAETTIDPSRCKNCNGPNDNPAAVADTLNQHLIHLVKSTYIYFGHQSRMMSYFGSAFAAEAAQRSCGRIRDGHQTKTDSQAGHGRSDAASDADCDHSVF